jgi:hypothetical protein
MSGNLVSEPLGISRRSILLHRHCHPDVRLVGNSPNLYKISIEPKSIQLEKIGTTVFILHQFVVQFSESHRNSKEFLWN